MMSKNIFLIIPLLCLLAAVYAEGTEQLKFDTIRNFLVCDTCNLICTGYNWNFCNKSITETKVKKFLPGDMCSTICGHKNETVKK